MMKYTEQGYGTSLSSSVDVEETLSPLGQEKISLTPLWEYVIRAQSLPESLDLDIFFETLHDRLRDPEWEVRQHALRVLVDFIPLIPSEVLDVKIEYVLGDLVANLGHLGPAVRKGAVDSLRAYANHTTKTDAVIRGLVEKGIANCFENKVHTNVVLGIILSLPFLISNKLSDSTITYIVHRLLDKIAKVIHQETVLRSLLRIREIIGHEKFNASLSSHESYNSKKEFDLLCEVYDLHTFRSQTFRQLESSVVRTIPQPEAITYVKTEDVLEEAPDVNPEEDRVILETEIQLESGPAITMKIHEESQKENEGGVGEVRSQTFKVLPDDSEPDDYEHLRRTPRRVRFGGEVVKLRTPDSDSNADDATISIISGDKPVIEIKYIENETRTTTRTSKSLIPIPVKHTQSLPNSPHRSNLKTARISRSSPNLSKTASGKKSRIPRRYNTEVRKTVETKIEIKIKEPKTESPLKKEEAKQTKIVRRNSREDEFSPVPIHNEIEVLHNLTRSPSPAKLKVDVAQTKLPDIGVTQKVAEPPKNADEKKKEDFASFHIYHSMNDDFYDFADSPIPTRDSGECLTCSSSGSETGGVERKRLDGFGVLDGRTIEDLQNMNDVRARQRGLEELLRIVQSREALETLRDRLPTLLYVLFSAEQQPMLQPVAEQTLSALFSSMDQQVLISRLHQISLNLSKMGSPLGVRLAILLMRRIPPGLLVDQLLAEPILGAKSSKVREGALQILMTVGRIFPSTDLNIPKSIKSVVSVLKDKKRKVRQAGLETLAALAQLSSTSTVLEVADEVTTNWNERDQILRVIRTRLSRKQLPAVNMNGNVRYSSPTGDSELEWLSRGNASLSPQHHPSSSIYKEDSAVHVKRRRFRSAYTEATSTEASSDHLPAVIKSARFFTYSVDEDEPPKSVDVNGNVEDSFAVVRQNSAKRFMSGFTNENTTEGTFSTSQEKSSSDGQPSGSTRSAVGGVKGDRKSSMKASEPSKLPTYDTSGRFVKIDPTSTAQRNDSAATYTAGSARVNYWKNNSRRQVLQVDEGDREVASVWSKEEPAGRAPTTQIWAIDPSAFGASEKLSTANGTLRQVYVVKTNESKTTATNTPPHDLREGATNTSPVYGRPASRGRSFSPPARRTKHHRQHYEVKEYDDEYDEYEEEGRFVHGGYGRREVQKRMRREERVRKSYSTEHLSVAQRLRKEEVASSGSSSGSSTRQTGNWHRDLRSGIPLPVFSDSKLRIRNRNTYKPKGPMSIPYYPPVKSPSPQTTPEKYTLQEPQHIIGRQPFSSGSESSGYFTPPPEPVTQEASPEATPEPTPESSPVSLHRTTPTIQPERFIQLDDTPELEASEDETKGDDAPEQKKFERRSTSNSLNEEALRDAEPRTMEETSKSTGNSLDGVDFTRITFSDKRTLSKSEFDIKISTHISRKNVGSAPALNEIVADFQTYEEPAPPSPKTTLPGSVEDEPPEKKKSITKLARRKSVRGGQPASSNLQLYPDTLKPFCKPKEAFHEVGEQLESGEWEVTMKGLQGLVRLIRHHREIVENQMHAVCVMLGKQIRNLRSQVARAACLVATELFGVSKRPLEMEIDELAAPLLHRTADTNKFLRGDANAALDEMCANLSVPKVVSVVTHRGCGHQNAVVRCASARILCNIVHRLGPEKVFQLPRDTRDKILLAGANMLTEGSLETRKHAKMLLGNIACHCQFQRAMSEAVPASVLRHIDKTLRSLMK